MTDTYTQLAGMLMQAEGARGLNGWLFGDVLASGGGSLRVVCGGLTLTQDDIHVPPQLSYSWTVDNGESHFLRRGDRLIVLVTADRQDYYILQKAVFS